MSSSIFGPVPSRRLGRSLGVDLLPYKTCTFDCVYCELGPTTCLTKERKPFKSIDTICNELKERLAQLKGALDYITLAGSGEPTLNSNLGALIERIKTTTRSPLAILTNSSLLSDPVVRAELRPLDLILPSLDAVTGSIFSAINRPVAGIRIEEIVEGLIKLRQEFKGKIWLEILLCEGINDNEAELGLLKNVLKQIRPDRVQINTVFRPPSENGIKPVSAQRLKEIEESMGENRESLMIHHLRGRANYESRSVKTRVLMLLKRRPCTVCDLMEALHMSRIDVIKLLERLVQEGEVVKICHQAEDYFKAVPSME